jgi:hypothetical protein
MTICAMFTESGIFMGLHKWQKGANVKVELMEGICIANKRILVAGYKEKA